MDTRSDRANGTRRTPSGPASEPARFALGTPNQDREERLARAERERAEEAIRRRLTEFADSVGPRYAHCSIGNFEIYHKAQVDVLATLRHYGRNIEENVRAGRGIVCFGPPGTGKDHALSALAAHAIRTSHTVRWVNGADLFGLFRDAIDGHGSERDLVARFSTPSVLILSDPQPQRGSLTEFQLTTLFRIVDQRYRSMRPTWVSMNVGGGTEADERISAPVIDRLRDDAICLHFDWPSYRTARSTDSVSGGAP